MHVNRALLWNLVYIQRNEEPLLERLTLFVVIAIFSGYFLAVDIATHRDRIGVGPVGVWCAYHREQYRIRIVWVLK